MGNHSTIWIVVNAEDTEEQATPRNAQGCMKLCDARIEAEADMLYAELCEQAKQLEPGAMIVMHQGGRRRWGGQLLKAAGWVKSKARTLTEDDAKHYERLWSTTSRWYNHWPATVAELKGEQIIFYELERKIPPQPSPPSIRPRSGDKFIPLHPNCTAHKRCSAYAQVDTFWQSVTGQPCGS
jgi:hypothetical protein